MRSDGKSSRFGQLEDVGHRQSLRIAGPVNDRRAVNLDGYGFGPNRVDQCARAPWLQERSGAGRFVVVALPVIKFYAAHQKRPPFAQIKRPTTWKEKVVVVKD